jgi:hypothetical protein
MLINIGKNNPISRSRTEFGFDDNIPRQKVIKKVGSSEARSILHCETNKCHDFLTQPFRFYDNPSCVSCFLVGTLPTSTIP